MSAKKTACYPFVYGGDAELFCDECKLPCKLDEMNVDCYRRFFLQGLVNCSYFVHGFCFLIDKPGCVFDNNGAHDTYWLQLLNEYFHNVNRKEEDEEFVKRREEVKKLVDEQIKRQNVYLCRYLEEYYNQVMNTGGGLSEDMLAKLDNAYMLLLRGISRKPD